MLPLLGVVFSSVTPRYELTFARDLASVHVEAVLPTTPSTLEIPLGAADDQPRGFATFVKRLSASSGGHAVQLTSSDKSSWTLAASPSAPLRLSYDVDLAFCRSKWPAGNEKAGLLLDGELFLVTKPLFVSDPKADGPATVRIQVPAGMHVTSPWKANSAGEFVIPHREDLIDNSLIVGMRNHPTFTSNGNCVTVALLGSMRKSKSIVNRALRAIIQKYAEVFPASRSYGQLVTLFYAGEENGEAYSSSSAFTTVAPVDRGTTLMWANTLAHETMHYWIGGKLHFADQATSEWFAEGFTEYMANLCLVQSGIFNLSTFLRKAEKNMANYEYCRFSSFFRTVNLQDSGKLKTRYHLAVYNGGWCIAFALDMMIRNHSGGKHSIATLLDKLYRTYAVPGNPITLDGLTNIASSLAGRNLTQFFNDYVQGPETLPLAGYCRIAGYRLMLQQYACEAYLTPDRSASRYQVAIRKSWLGQ
jgi:predicted metalloprotease with PDZ domain